MADLYLGLISGTSVDAIDAALVRFGATTEVVASYTHPYPPALRARVLEISQSPDPVALDAYARLDVELGHAFADAADAVLARSGVARDTVRAIGSHGQTLLHAPRGDVPYTMQAGDPNVVAERTRIATVADFRRRDVAAGGEGAPLMPILHAALLADTAETRVALNLGGIANVTRLGADGSVLGFDTGPANALLDAWSLERRGTPRDDDGAWARSGRVDERLLARLLDEPYFAKPAPKSSGRDAFNLAWLARRGGELGALAPADVQATLAELTAVTVARAVAAAAPDAARVIACGGGVHNGWLMQRLSAALAPIALETTAAYGVDPDFVEAVGFAWLAKATLEGRAGNLPAVTGARGPRVLGAIYAA